MKNTKLATILFLILNVAYSNQTTSNLIKSSEEIQETLSLIQGAIKFHLKTETSKSECQTKIAVCNNRAVNEILSQISKKSTEFNDDVAGKEEGGWNFEEDILGTTNLITDFIDIALIQVQTIGGCHDQQELCSKDLLDIISEQLKVELIGTQNASNKSDD